MKLVFYILLISSVASAQTVHIEDDRIVYKGKARVDRVAHDELVANARQVILDLNGRNEPEISQAGNGTNLSSEAVLKLGAPDRVSKKVKYFIQIDVKKDSYEYCIDSVYLLQKEPGHTATKASSEEVLKKMESSGPVAASTEKVLNEIDMNFQKIIDRITNGMMTASTINTSASTH